MAKAVQTEEQIVRRRGRWKPQHLKHDREILQEMAAKNCKASRASEIGALGARLVQSAVS
jgi:hypothetical protein